MLVFDAPSAGVGKLSSRLIWKETPVAEFMRKVLVVEDDRETAGQMAACLADGGYAVDLAVDGNEALERGRSGDYAVITVDRLLPGLDGLEVVQRLRTTGVTTPALIISALGEVDDRVRGFRAGGDDYLGKPFALAEMLARVDALARRSGTVVKETVLRVADLEMDLLARRARRGAVGLELLPREFQLLEYFMRNEGRVVSRAMLLANVWDVHFDPMTNIVEVYVGRLGSKIGG